MAKKKEEIQYYTIVFEKYIDIMTESDRLYYVISNELKEQMNTVEHASWENSSIPDFMETCVILNSMRNFLDKKINDPPPEEVKFCNKNNIKDVLMTREDLTILQGYSLAVEEQKALLLLEHGFSFQVN